MYLFIIIIINNFINIVVAVIVVAVYESGKCVCVVGVQVRILLLDVFLL